jgi:hypothetical protein
VQVVQRRDHLLSLRSHVLFPLIFYLGLHVAVDDFVRMQVVQRRDHLLRYVLALELAHGAVFFFLKATIDKFTTLCNLQHTEIIRFAMFWQLQLTLAAVFFLSP